MVGWPHGVCGNLHGRDEEGANAASHNRREDKHLCPVCTKTYGVNLSARSKHRVMQALGSCGYGFFIERLSFEQRF